MLWTRKGRYMKKTFIAMTAALCMLLAGCNNKFARDEYNDSAMTLDYDTVNENSSTDDSVFSYDDDYTIYDTGYSETDMVTDTSYDSVLCTAAAFDGRKDLCVLASGKSSRSTLSIALSLTSGTAEIVIVNGGNIQTAVECGSETKSISKTVEIALDPNKKYIVQLVGNNCRDIELTMGINRDI